MAKSKKKKLTKAKAKAKRPAKKPAPKKKVVKAKARPKAKPKKVVKAKARPKAKPKKVAKPAPKKPLAKAAPAPKAKAPPPAKAKPAPVKVRKPVVYVSPATIPPAKIHRRDGAGHLDPDYAERLLELSGGATTAEREEEDSHAFIGEHDAPSREPLSRELGREVIEQATSGEYVAEDNLNAEVEEDEGGPFVPSTEAEEVAHGTDPSNPKRAKREPVPKAMSGDDEAAEEIEEEARRESDR